MKATIPIAIPPGTKMLRIERVPDGYWKLWLNTNNFKHGTFLELHDDGSILRTTIRTDDVEETITVKEADG